MSSPGRGVISAFQREDEALAFWTQLGDNDQFTVFEVRINAFCPERPPALPARRGRPPSDPAKRQGPYRAELPVCWIVAPSDLRHAPNVAPTSR